MTDRGLALRDRPEGCPLSHGEWYCMHLVDEGYAYDEIAERRGITPGTVRTHMKNAFRKLGVNSSAQAVVRMREADWYPMPVVEPEEGPLSPAQKAYLAAFDRYLRIWAGSCDPAESEEERRARLEMRYMLGAIYVEAQVPMPQNAAPHAAPRHSGSQLALAA